MGLAALGGTHSCCGEPFWGVFSGWLSSELATRSWKSRAGAWRCLWERGAAGIFIFTSHGSIQGAPGGFSVHLLSSHCKKPVLEKPQHFRLTSHGWGWRGRGVNREEAKAECFLQLLFPREWLRCEWEGTAREDTAPRAAGAGSVAELLTKACEGNESMPRMDL